ncbi:DUF1214 domain-containing protein [Dyella soli]|uniref:DUF1214 domain-containing protein n=1 Tax=Dyella soli TaxID=522319 RepID=UPI00197AA362|nr:DUF1214 domain-containing protein [Dyella soli]
MSLILVAVFAAAAHGQAVAPLPTDKKVSDSYIYLLSRLLVLNQQQADFDSGFKWNQLVHRKVGDVAWPNPNLDVAYSEAWVAIDDKSCALVSVPKVKDRYYTVQFLNGWGETVANINERVYPQHPDGEFAVCLKGADIQLPKTTQRVDVSTTSLRVLSRVELGANRDEAVALQKRFNIHASGHPVVPEVPATVRFDIEKLPGVEAFESATLALDSAADTNPGMEKLQASTRAIARAIKEPGARQHVDQVIHQQAIPSIYKASPTLGDGTVKNGWAVPSTIGVYGSNWLLRTLVNLGGIWANTYEEVIYYKGFVDPDGKPLNGDRAYALRFEKDQLPSLYATHFWSVIAVDAVHRRVLPNPLKRYLLNNFSKLTYGEDGSLTLYFGATKPKGAPDGNWIPTPKGTGYSLTFRFYRPKGAVADRTYFPPGLKAQ